VTQADRRKRVGLVLGTTLLVIANANDVFLFFRDTVPEVAGGLFSFLPPIPPLDAIWPALRVALSLIGVVLLWAVWRTSSKPPIDPTPNPELATLRGQIAQIESQLTSQVEPKPDDFAVAARSRWLPDPTDLTTFAMTRDDLDEALARAETAASNSLAPDAVVEFLNSPTGFTVAPSPSLCFAAWSRIAAKFCWVYVYETYEFTTALKRGSYRTYGGEQRWPDKHDEEPGWVNDDGWLELVRQAGYRLRGMAGLTASLSWYDGGSERGWSTGWVLSAVDEERDWKQAYSLKDGTITEYYVSDRLPNGTPVDPRADTT
jgi:hypothetical protein